MRRLCALLLLACGAPHGKPTAAQGSAEAASSPPLDVIVAPPSGAPQLPAGARCETALPLAASGASSALLTETASAPVAMDCGPALGAAGAYFVLDLSALPAPVPVQLLFDAPVPFEVGLARGSCGDLHIEQCATPLYSDERSRVISAPLAPDRYIVRVDGAAAGAALHVSASTGAVGCSAAPAHDECSSALALDPQFPVQSVTGTLACARPSLPSRCSAPDAADVFYALDLTGRAGETLLDVSVTSPDDSPATASLYAASDAGCGELWMCGAQFTARLTPGMYRVGVSEGMRVGGPAHPGLPAAASGEPNPFALRIGLDQVDCSQTPNGSWQTAIDLDPSAELQQLHGNTVCGTPQLGAACVGDRGAPELYYRLDLRGASGMQGLEVRSLLGADSINYVLLADPAGGAPQYTSCDRNPGYYSSYHLAPRLYYLVVDGRVRNAARFDLELTLKPVQQDPLPCLRDWIDSCMADSEPACSDSQANPRCLATAVECGLEQSVYDAFCSGAPGCCSGTAEGIDCLDAWQSTTRCR